MSRYLPSLETFAKGTIATLATVSTVSLSLLYYGQNYLIYPSAYISVGGQHRTHVDTPDLYGLDWEDISLETSDGEKLQCFLLLQRKELGDPTRFQRISPTVINYSEDESDDEFMARRPTVIMFHGNGGNAGHRIPLGMMFQLRMRCNVLMVEYRGYGQSSGSPSEAGIQMDAQTALDFVLHDPRLKNTKIILYGQSLGGAVAIDLTSRNPAKVTALILENTFTTLPSLVPHLFPVLKPLPYKWMCTEKWESADKVHLIPWTLPVLLLSGVRDELVPQEHMLKLKELFENLGDWVDDDDDDATPSSHPTSRSSAKHEEEMDDTSSVTLGRNDGAETNTISSESWRSEISSDMDIDDTVSGETLSFAPYEQDDDMDVDPPTRPRHSFSTDVTTLRARRPVTSADETSVRSSALPSNPTSSNEKLSESLEKESQEKSKRIRQGKKRLTWVELPFGGHNDTATQRGYWDAVEDFLSPYSGILPRDIRKSERKRIRQLEREAEDRARQDAAREAQEQEARRRQEQLEEEFQRLRQMGLLKDGTETSTMTDSVYSSSVYSDSMTSSLSDSTFSSDMSSVYTSSSNQTGWSSAERYSRLHREVDGMEEELRGMEQPSRLGSSDGSSRAISTADLLREFGFDSYEKMKHEGDSVLANAEKALGQD